MKRVTILIVTVLVAATTASLALDVSGIEIPLQRGELRLQGAGVLRKGFFFDVYVGALYLEDPQHATTPLANVPKQLDIYYRLDSPRERMIKVAHQTLAKNLSGEQLSALQPQIRKLHAAYRDGKKGSRASLRYIPGKGLTYLFDDDPILTLVDDTFANAYFCVWLGAPPSSTTMKAALLGDKREDGNEQ